MQLSLLFNIRTFVRKPSNIRLTFVTLLCGHMDVKMFAERMGIEQEPIQLN